MACAGTLREDARACDEIWRLSSFHIMDGEVPSVMLFIISLLGPTYNGNFQAPLSQYQTYGIITPRNLSNARTGLFSHPRACGPVRSLIAHAHAPPHNHREGGQGRFCDSGL